MSETKKMTDEEKIQEIDRQIARVIDLQEKRIADYNRQIAEDYRNFWKSRCRLTPVGGKKLTPSSK